MCGVGAVSGTLGSREDGTRAAEKAGKRKAREKRGGSTATQNALG